MSSEPETFVSLRVKNFDKEELLFGVEPYGFFWPMEKGAAYTLIMKAGAGENNTIEVGKNDKAIFFVPLSDILWVYDGDTELLNLAERELPPHLLPNST